MTDRDARMSSASAPLVSVVMPTFNSERTVLRALRSVQSQTCQDFEIVIADDASSDDTKQKVDSLGDARITFLPSVEKTNLGPAVTRNRALAAARGKYIAFLDSDDEWLPEKLERQLHFLEANPQCSIVVTDAYDVSPNGAIHEKEFDSSPPVSGAQAWRTLLKYSFIETSSVMTRRALAQELGGFNAQLFVSQDQDLWIRLALRGDVGIIDEPLGKIHQVPTGHMTRNRHRQAEIMLPMIEGHVAKVRERLTPSEVDEILGHRYQVVGRDLFFHGYRWLGLKLLARASRHNGNWLGNLFYLLHANSWAVSIKRALRSGDKPSLKRKAMPLSR